MSNPPQGRSPRSSSGSSGTPRWMRGGTSPPQEQEEERQLEVSFDDELTDAPAPPGDVRWPDGPLLWDPGLPERCYSRLWEDPEAQVVRDYLTRGKGEARGGADGRRLSEDAIRAWRLGAHRDRRGSWWVAIPLRDSSSQEIVNVKFCLVPNEQGERPKPKYMACRDRPLPLFGAHALQDPRESGTVVVVEGELDVVAMWCFGWETGVVSGSAGAGTFSEEWLEQLESYQHFVLAYDNDKSGDPGADTLAEKLGKYRCERARLPFKDAGQCLVEGVEACDVEIAIERAKPYTGVQVRLASSYCDEIEQDIENPQRLIGRPTGSLKLDELFAGWGDGLNVITGPSGVGKTTWLTWAMWNATGVGSRVCVIPLEQAPKKIVQKLLRIELQGDFLEYTANDRREAYRRIDQRGIVILDRYGFLEKDELIETIRYQKRRNGVTQYLLDHMGFMVKPGDEERAQIDDLVRTFAKLGEDEGVAINMIAHPNHDHRRNGGRQVEVGDLKGSSAIEQDAAMILIVERDYNLGKKDIPHGLIKCGKLRKEWGLGTGKSKVQYYDAPSTTYADEEYQLPGGQQATKGGSP